MTDTSHTTQPGTGQPSTPPGDPRRVGWLAAGILIVIVVVVAGAALVVRALGTDRSPTSSAPTNTAPSSSSRATAVSSSPASSVSASSSSASATATTTPQERAGAQAQAAYRKYLSVVDQVSQAGGARPERLKAIAVGDALQQEQYSAAQYRSQRWRQIGNTVLARSGIVSVSLKTDAKTFTVPEVVLTTCTDVRKAVAVRQDGTTVRPSSSPLFGRWRITLRDYPSLGGWLVAKEEGKGVSAC